MEVLRKHLGRADLAWLGWYHETALLSSEQHGDPFVRELEDALGLTREWRLELCRRAATLPPETGIACDPDNYAL